MGWTEADSRLYQELAAVAVPERAEQIAALLTLLPFSPSDTARVAELGCGEGRLSAALLDAYPQVSVVALDGSEDMRAATATRLARFGQRARVAPFELALDEWWPFLDGADAVLSSLAVHHLDGAAKQRLFEAVARRLSPRGALLIADLVEPARPEAREVFAAGWDRAAKRQSAAGAFQHFVESRWNIFHYPDPDVDMPSRLFDQLRWLAEAGFVSVDCFWLKAGHAIYGGYLAAQRTSGAPLRFGEALAAAERALLA